MQMCVGEGNDEWKLFERIEEAREGSGEAMHGERW
jgi:hypothetical protein